jgi:hypothetical protein
MRNHHKKQLRPINSKYVSATMTLDIQGMGVKLTSQCERITPNHEGVVLPGQGQGAAGGLLSAIEGTAATTITVLRNVHASCISTQLSSRASNACCSTNQIVASNAIVDEGSEVSLGSTNQLVVSISKGKHRARDKRPVQPPTVNRQHAKSRRK